MSSNRALSFSLIALALVLSCSASGAREGSAPASQGGTATAQAKVEYREGLTKVDFTGLDDASKERVLKLLNEHKCDCGCAFSSIAECRVKDQGCGRSPVLAKMLIDAVKAGKNDAQVAAALKENSQPAPAAAPALTPTGPVQISLEGAQVKGKPSAKATLVEYADFQCPYCVRAVPVVDQILQKYPDDVKFVFKQLPLTSIHRFAEPAARANLAAGRQEKFWQMYEVLFQNSRALDDASLKKYAQDLGLDMERFEKDFNDPAIAQEIQEDVAESQRLGVSGTPSFFLNGVKVPSWDIETLSKMVETARSGGDVSASVAEINQRLRDQQAAAQQARQAQMAAQASQVVEIDLIGAPIKGDPKAPVTIVEFGDFQCPYCAKAQPLIKQVYEAFPGKVKLAFKHLPLLSIHPNARPAAIASAEAMEQGKFWEMHDLLYANFSKLDRANLSNIAKQAGLDMPQFEKALETDEHKQIVEKDLADSQRYGVNSTPTFFVNGKRVMNRDFETFKKMIEDALAATNQRASR